MDNELCFVCGEPATIRKTNIIGAPYGKTKVSDPYYVCEKHKLVKKE